MVFFLIFLLLSNLKGFYGFFIQFFLNSKTNEKNDIEFNKTIYEKIKNNCEKGVLTNICKILNLSSNIENDAMLNLVTPLQNLPIFNQNINENSTISPSPLNVSHQNISNIYQQFVPIVSTNIQSTHNQTISPILNENFLHSNSQQIISNINQTINQKNNPDNFPKDNILITQQVISPNISQQISPKLPIIF